MKWICQICHIVRSVRESDLWSVRPCGRPWESDLWGRESPWEAVWESDRPLMHTGRCCDPWGRLTDFTAKRIASAGRVRSPPGVRERPIGLPHGLSRTLRQITWFESPIGLSRTAGNAVILGPVWLISRLNALHRPVCVRGRSDSHRSDSQICEADRPLTHSGRCSPILRAIWLISRLNALHRPVCVRGRSASQIWESDGALWLAQTDHMTNCERPCACEAEFRTLRSERPCAWEAVRGRAPLIGSDRSGTLWHRSLSQWEEHGLSRPLRHTASQIWESEIRPLIHRNQWKCPNFSNFWQQ